MKLLLFTPPPMEICWNQQWPFPLEEHGRKSRKFGPGNVGPARSAGGTSTNSDPTEEMRVGHAAPQLLNWNINATVQPQQK